MLNTYFYNYNGDFMKFPNSSFCCKKKMSYYNNTVMDTNAYCATFVWNIRCIFIGIRVHLLI